MSGSDNSGREGSQERRRRRPEWTAPTRQTIPGSATPDQWRPHLRSISGQRVSQLQERSQSPIRSVSPARSQSSRRSLSPARSTSSAVSATSSHQSVSPTPSVFRDRYTPPPRTPLPANAGTSGQTGSPTVRRRPDSPFPTRRGSGGRRGYVPALPPMPDIDRYGYGSDSDDEDFAPIQRAPPHRQSLPVQHIPAFRPQPAPGPSASSRHEVAIDIPEPRGRAPTRANTIDTAMFGRGGVFGGFRPGTLESGFNMPDNWIRERDPMPDYLYPRRGGRRRPQPDGQPLCLLCGDERSIPYYVCGCRGDVANICYPCLRASVVAKAQDTDQRYDHCYTCNENYRGLLFVVRKNTADRRRERRQFMAAQMRDEWRSLVAPIPAVASLNTVVGVFAPDFWPYILGLSFFLLMAFYLCRFREYSSRSSVIPRPVLYRVVDVRIDTRVAQPKPSDGHNQ